MPTAPSISSCVRSSAFRKGYRDKSRGSTALDTHQDTVLVFVARCGNRFAHVTHIGDAFSADFQNDIAFLEATFGCRALRIDLGYHDALLAGAGHAIGRSKRKPEF